MDWYRSETWRAYERPESEVTGNKADDYERRAPGTAGMREGVRYQVYDTADGRHVLFMASEQAFWKNFCEALDRLDLFERWPGSKFADHARATPSSSASRASSSPPRRPPEWLEFGGRVNTPIAPVNTPKTLLEDPQFRTASSSTRRPSSAPTSCPRPIKFVGEELPPPTTGPDRGPAPRGGPARGPRLGRRTDGRGPGRRGLRGGGRGGGGEEGGGRGGGGGGGGERRGRR